MREQVFRNIFLILFSCFIGSSAFAIEVGVSKVITNSTINNNQTLGRPAGADGDDANGYVISFDTASGGGRYLFRSQAATGGYVKVGRGNSVMLENFNGDGYTYISWDELLANKEKYAAYIADGSFAGQGTKLIATTALREFQMISNHIDARIKAALDGETPLAPTFSASNANAYFGSKGMSAGDMNPMYGVWAQAGWSHIKDTNSATEFKGNLYTGTVGADYKVTEESLVGISYSFGTISDGKSEFNRGEFKQKTHSVSPYFAYRFSDCMSVDAFFGYSHVKKDFDRTSANLQGTTILFTTGEKFSASSVKAHRWYGSIAANAAHQPMEDLTVILRAGYHHLSENQKDYTALNNLTNKTYNEEKVKTKLGSLYASLTAAYLIDKWFEPFAEFGVDYNATLDRQSFEDGYQPKYDRTGFKVGGGFKLYSTDYWSSIVKVDYAFGHGNLKVFTGSASVRYVF